MNIYNKLYIIEYIRSPIQLCYINKTLRKFWHLNKSKHKCHYWHRCFDLPAIIHRVVLSTDEFIYGKEWRKYGKLKRYMIYDI